MLEQCEMIIGFLIPHRCENPALGVCEVCGKGFCEEHLSITPSGMICNSCESGETPTVPAPVFASAFSEDDFSLFDDFGQDEDSEDMFSDLS